MTPADVHDGVEGDDLVQGDEAAAYGDKGYASGDRRGALEARGIKPRVHVPGQAQ